MIRRGKIYTYGHKEVQIHPKIPRTLKCPIVITKFKQTKNDIEHFQTYPQINI